MIGLILGLAAAAQQPDTREEPRTIVVTGERIRDLRAALEACLRRNCPPNEDVDASLALAEGEFLNGDYDKAEEWIGASLGRNRQHSQAYPEPVADLYRSQARVRLHRGRDYEAAQSTRNVLRALRAGIPQEDHRHLTARFERVQMEIRAGNRTGAERELRDLIDTARRAGRDDIVRHAQMRQLFHAYVRTPRGTAAARVRRLAESTDPNQRQEAVAARLFLARQYRERGDIARSDDMLARIPPSDGDARTLLHAPPIELGSYDFGIYTFEDKWIDVAFWIDPEGRTEGVEIVRQGAVASWAEPVLDAIRGRLYSPSADRAASYRLERYTFTAARAVRTGSRLVQNSGPPRVEYLDLTARDEPGREAPVTIAPSGN